MNVVDKIKNLLLKTVENGCSEQESNTAFILARKLMIKYKLSESDITASDENKIIQEELNFNFDDDWKYCLLNVFISNNPITSILSPIKYSSEYSPILNPIALIIEFPFFNV